MGNQKSGLLKALDEERCALAEKVVSGVLHLETIYHNNIAVMIVRVRASSYQGLATS